MIIHSRLRQGFRASADKLSDLSQHIKKEGVAMQNFEWSIEIDAEATLRAYGVSPHTGFLPESPLRWLPTEQHMHWQDPDNWQDAHFLELDRFVYNLPKFIKARCVRKEMKRLSLPQKWPPRNLDERSPVTFRLMQGYAMGTQAYWQEKFGYRTVRELIEDTRVKALPSKFAVPLWHLSRVVGMEPTMSYTLYAPWNYARKNPDIPHSFDNIDVLHTFTDTIDEKWFIKIHQGVDIILAEAIQNLMRAYLATRATFDIPSDLITKWLAATARSCQEAVNLLKRMREHCDSRTYFNRVRVFYTFPSNVVFKGVKELHGKPQNLFGETGGQDPGIHFRLAVLGVDHSQDPYFRRMRTHMPRRARQLLETVDDSRLREYVRTYARNTALVEHYNDCVQSAVDWRLEHRSLVQEYIQDFGESHGTGKPPLEWLDKLIQETREAFILP